MTRRPLWQWAVMVLLAWGVFALGAARPWGYLPLLAGMGAYGAAALLKRDEAAYPGRGLCLSLVAVTGAVFLQLIPLPMDLLGLFSPARVAVAEVHDGAVLAAGAVGHAGLGRWAQSRSLSVDPNATALGLACVGSLGLFLLGAARATGPDGARRLTAGLVGLGVIVALVGIAEAATSWGAIYRAAWQPLPPDSSPHGPFSSRNHYAGWMLMTLPLALGALGATLERARPRAGLLRDDAEGRRLAESGGMAGIAPILVGLGAAVVMAVALVQTRSRAGILCLALAIVMLGAPLVRRGASTRSRMLVASSLALVLLAGLLVTGVRPIAGRFAAASWSTAHGRLPIWRQAARMARDFPLTGSGLNTYQTIVPLYTTTELDEPYEAAHNDYLQLAVEGGLLVGVPVLAAVAFFVRETRQRFRDPAEGRASRWLRTGAVVGLSVVAVQETVDFSLQVPGNAALFVMLAAIAIHRVATPPSTSVRRVLETQGGTQLNGS